MTFTVETYVSNAGGFKRAIHPAKRENYEAQWLAMRLELATSGVASKPLPKRTPKKAAGNRAE